MWIPSPSRLQVLATWVALTLLVALTGCRDLWGRPKPVLRLVFAADPAVAVATAREQLVTKAGDVLTRRLDKLRVNGSGIRVYPDRVEVELPLLEPAELAAVKTVLSRTGRLEFKMVDDEDDFVGRAAASARERAASMQVDVKTENASTGQGKTNTIHYASVVKRHEETLATARVRLEGFFRGLQIPPERELGYGRADGADEGWRTWLLLSRPELANEDIAEAEAVQDKTVGRWTVGVRFTRQGTARFEELTGRNVKRRLAIVLDGVVESAPVIQERIGGGRAVVTMTATSPDQERDARQLALVLQTGALPFPIVLSREERISP